MQALFRNRRALVFGAAAAWLAAPYRASAQVFPGQPIRLIVPFPPGGSTDLMGRAIGKAIGDSLNATVVVDNRVGAGGSIGAAEVARAKPDGYTLLLAAVTSHAVYQNFYPKTAKFNLTTDFDPVALVGEVPQAFVTHPAVKANSLNEFIALARANPGKLSIASGGVGTTQQMAALLMAINSDIKVLHVSYKGSGPAAIDVMGGQVDAMFGTVPSVQEHLKTGRLRLLGVTAQTRLPAFPQVPTFRESGLQGMDLNSNFGVLAPAGTPPERLDILARAIERGVAQKAVQDSLTINGVIVDVLGPAPSRMKVLAEVRKYEEVIRRTGVKPD